MSGLRVLLVEDNELNQQVAAELLSDAGFVVELAGNGQEALAKLRQQPVDLVLLILRPSRGLASPTGMASMDGYELCRQLKLPPQTRRLLKLIDGHVAASKMPDREQNWAWNFTPSR